MDSFYDVEGAGLSRKDWRLCTFEDDDDVGTEVIFTLQGVLSKSNLVPRHVREFAQYFCGTPVSKWQVEVGPIGSVFSANNRLFTLKTDAPTEQGTEFEPGVDPVGILERFKTADMFHSPENVVKYFRVVSDPEQGEIKYLQSFPGAFRVGDVVEMQASFVAIMTSQGQIKVTSRLHALTLLDTGFTYVNGPTYEADKKRMAFQSKTMVLQKQVKRKIGYVYEEEEPPRKRAHGDALEEFRETSMG
ncbi:hypothetical protein C8F04DRAFT_1188795 [Mycena alexandri]|uniref:Uncharacterized protein n=1 Tax=Mycena alexandri TaxID=1745969 RepID=A0AAD6S3E7_9AGAR|nr:hypothetical protein C8F04DRAFT_1197601 [Mycena alexandri]KAJ7028255.1 hypothetical protein C8F04DRAFT_1188795 [Mycena alexandri]